MIKCHYCGKPLANGLDYSLACSCGNCFITFNKSGDVIAYHLKFFDGKTDYFPSKGLFEDKASLYNQKIFKLILKLNVNLTFNDGMPEVYKIYDKITKMIAFT